MKFHRIDRIAWGNSINEVLSVKSLPLISALKSGSEDRLRILESADSDRLHLGPGEEVTLTFKSKPLDEGRERTFIFVSEGFYIPLPMIRFAGN
jgi:hypothetical protein